jgi:DNA-binding GntR family transcriptional regulator
MMFEQMMRPRQKAQAVAQAAERLGRADAAAGQALADLWDKAFEEGRLAALDEFQDRFCTCMKS